MRANPYVGPRPFELEDKDLFFGRDQESLGLLSLVLSQRVVLFFAPSGAGKSSLINARLLPGLNNEGFVVLPVGRIKGSEQPTRQSIANIFTYNLLNSISSKQGIDVPDFLSIASFLEDTSFLNEDKPKVLIIDQFEELFTSHLDRWQERKPFFDQLRQALDSNPLLWLILAMREDHIANLEPYTSLLPGRLQTRFHMPRMNAAGALEAIKRPAERAGRSFAPGVAEELVDNLRQIHSSATGEKHLGEFVEPVQLQVVCRQLWNNLANRNSNIITSEDVSELGDIDAALAQFYDGAVQEVARSVGISELKIRNWFESELITETGTRALVYKGAEQTASLSNFIVNELSNRYLIRSETRPGGTWYELVHDRFILPIQRSNRDWLSLQNPILQDAYAWERSDRDKTLLYQGGRLELALLSLEEETSDPLAFMFLKAGQDAQEQHALVQRAATAKRDRALLVIFILLFFGMAMMASLFWQQRQKAVENALVAQEAQIESSQGRATIVANATIQADQLIALKHSLEQQLLLLEEQKALLGTATRGFYQNLLEVTPRPTPTLINTIPTETRQATSAPTSSTGTGEAQSRTPTPAVEAIETQIAQVNATQTAIAVPNASLSAIFPDVPVAVRDAPSAESEIKEYVVNGPTMPVTAISDTWIQVEFPDGHVGWVVGVLLTFSGDIDQLPLGLHYRFIENRNRADMPFVYGQVDSQEQISLLRDPRDLDSVITTLPSGTDVTILLNVAGDEKYGSGRWYLVDVVQGIALWTGYLPVEVVVQRE